MVENITEFKIKQFEEFYNLLMKEAPKEYTPWFFPCAKNGKNPSPQAILKINQTSKGSWHHESARLNKEQCIEHIKQSYNLGLSAREGDPLIIIDIDEAKYLDQVPKNTLVVKSRKRAGYHAFCWDGDGSAKINLPTDYGEIRSNNQYVLACGSYVGFNMADEKDKEAFSKLPEDAKYDKELGFYTIHNPIIPRKITFSECPQFFQDKESENIEAESKIFQREEIRSYENKSGKYTELFDLKVSDIVGSMPSNKRTGHPLHESDTDANWSLSKDGCLGHCWRHMVSLNAVQYLCVKVGYSKCEDAGTPHKGRGVSKIRGDKKAYSAAYEEAVRLKIISHIQPTMQIFSRQVQAKDFYDKQPYFYDKSGLWWFWDQEESYWKITDETDILCMINEAIGVDTIKPMERGEILNALKQAGRKNTPREISPTWIQFKDEIFDVATGETFAATPEYFVTNPIPYEINRDKSSDTPTMDRIFTEWVGKKYVETLYEIISYCLLPNYPMSRLFCFIGSGMNGKSKFLELLTKFIGADNCTSTELDTLLTSRFEITRLHKKLVCIMGETDFNEMSKTSILKKLTGGDLIGFEYKNKNPFHGKNYAKILIATNNLPTTTDKTIGFYRRWLIIDFPNQFSEKKDILGDIPEEEYNCLARKCCTTLKNLLDEREFHEEGSIEERKIKYEAKSDFLQKFIDDFTEEDADGNITKSDFNKKFVGWSKENRHREMSETSLGIKLKSKGFEVGKKYFSWMHDGRGGDARVIFGVRWRV